MAKTRLNQTHRDILRGFAEKAIECKAEQKTRDKLYAKAAGAVRRCIEKQYPASDMAVLANYGVTSNDAIVDGGSPEGRFTRFAFDQNDEIPARPKVRYDAARVNFDAKATEAIDAYDLAADALKKARAAKLSDYNALIASAKTFEDILDVWPAAAAVSERIKRQQTSLAVLSAEKIAAIRADNAGANLPVLEAA